MVGGVRRGGQSLRWMGAGPPCHRHVTTSLSPHPRPFMLGPQFRCIMGAPETSPPSARRSGMSPRSFASKKLPHLRIGYKPVASKSPQGTRREGGFPTPIPAPGDLTVRCGDRSFHTRDTSGQRIWGIGVGSLWWVDDPARHRR